MKLKLISDGTTVGTKLVDEDSGQPIGYIQNIKWEVDVKEPFAKVTVTILKVPVEIEVS